MNTTTDTSFPTEYLVLALILVLVALTLFGGLANTLQAQLERAVIPATTATEQRSR